jgi:hypothetical protein
MNPSMQGDNSNIIVVTAETKAFIWKVGLVVKRFDMFSYLNDFVEKNSVKTNNTGIDQCIKDHPFILLTRCSNYFRKNK